MRIYGYHPSTGEYLGTDVARENPVRKGDYIFPANTTAESPPPAEDGQSAVWDGSKWNLVPDLRGQAYYLPDGRRHVIDELGDELPDDAALEKPARVKRQEAINWIDATADRIRASGRSVGQHLDAEYQIVAEALIEYRNNPGGEGTDAIQSYASAEGLTVDEAAKQIAEAAARAVELLQDVRRIRLAGKAAIRAAGEDADFMETAQPYIDQLEALIK